MKKHQKILIGLMALGLVGGVGATIALTRTGAKGSYNGQGTDSAIYLNWGDSDQQTAVTTEVKNLAANAAQYRCVVVSPKASTALTGNVEVTFVLSVGEKTELPGFTVGIYASESYSTTKPADTTANAILSMAEGGTKEYTASFSVTGSTPKYYVLEFNWDGSGLTGTDTTFGGSLKISQDYKEATGA